jgi:hypothetical protein
MTTGPVFHPTRPYFKSLSKSNTCLCQLICSTRFLHHSSDIYKYGAISVLQEDPLQAKGNSRATNNRLVAEVD